MNAYLFNFATGLYEAEIFVEAAKLQSGDGITAIPPPDYESGQVPVFDHHQQEGVVIPATIARQLLNISPPRSQENPV